MTNIPETLISETRTGIQTLIEMGIDPDAVLPPRLGRDIDSPYGTEIVIRDHQTTNRILKNFDTVEKIRQGFLTLREIGYDAGLVYDSMENVPVDRVAKIHMFRQPLYSKELNLE